MLKQKSSEVGQKSVVNSNLDFFIFNLKQDNKHLKDHTLIARLLNKEFKLNLTKQDIEYHYGFNDIQIDCLEDEHRKQKYKL